MTEYWQSTGKKFCEICKVWFADNKISRERHEQGLKHKGMVQQRIKESQRKAKEKETEDMDLRLTLIQMERAASAAMVSEGGSKQEGVLSSARHSAHSSKSSDIHQTNRTLCPVCKVWISNTKGSIEMHEKGSQHRSLVSAHEGDLALREVLDRERLKESEDDKRHKALKRQSEHIYDSIEVQDREPTETRVPYKESCILDRKRIKRETRDLLSTDLPQYPDGLVEIKTENNITIEGNFSKNLGEPSSSSSLGPWIPIIKQNLPKKELYNSHVSHQEKELYLLKKIERQECHRSLSEADAAIIEATALPDVNDIVFRSKEARLGEVMTSGRKVVEFRKLKKTQQPSQRRPHL